MGGGLEGTKSLVCAVLPAQLFWETVRRTRLLLSVYESQEESLSGGPLLFPSTRRGPLSPLADTRSWRCPRHSSGQEERIFCKLLAWFLLMPISVPASLELRGQQASVILVARGSGLEMFRMWDGSQRESEAGTVSLDGKEMGVHRGSWGPADARAGWSRARQRGRGEEATPRTASPPPRPDLTVSWLWLGKLVLERGGEGGEWALIFLGLWETLGRVLLGAPLSRAI